MKTILALLLAVGVTIAQRGNPCPLNAPCGKKSEPLEVETIEKSSCPPNAPCGQRREPNREPLIVPIREPISEPIREVIVEPIREPIRIESHSCPPDAPCGHRIKPVKLESIPCPLNAPCGPKVAPIRILSNSCPPNAPCGIKIDRIRFQNSGDLCHPNPCGANAVCRPGHDNTGRDRPVCTCPPGWIGNALNACHRGECITHQDCPPTRLCYNSVCENPCIGACGANADCRVDKFKEKAICSCPRGYLGHPFQSCRRETPEDLCSPNPCGRNAICRPGYDNTGKDRPVCTCPDGYYGNPILSCNRGDK